MLGTGSMGEETTGVDWNRIITDPGSFFDDFDWTFAQHDCGEDYTGEEGEGEAW
jgi:hypothetical protein